MILVGLFASYSTVPLVFACVPVIGMLIFGLTPKQLGPLARKQEKLKKLLGVYKELYKDNKISEEELLQALTATRPIQLGLISAIRKKEVRNPLLLLWFLIFTQQYTGGPANLVYSQIVHSMADNPYPQVCAVVYSFVFLITTVLALKCTPALPRKTVMIASCSLCFCVLAATASYFYFKNDLLSINSSLCWIPLILLCLYSIIHSLGINVMPLLIMSEAFPQEYNDLVYKFHTIYFSISAVVSTKIFQVLFGRYGMHMGFVYLAANALGATVVLLMFMKESKIVNEQPDINIDTDKGAKLVYVTHFPETTIF